MKGEAGEGFGRGGDRPAYCCWGTDEVVAWWVDVGVVNHCVEVFQSDFGEDERHVWQWNMGSVT